MTPTAPELLTGCVQALSAPPPPEHAGAFMAATVGVSAMLDLLCAQECATGAAARVWENAALRSVLAEADPAHGVAPPTADDGDFSLVALDAANAALRRALTTLHAAAESAGDRALDRRILALYRQMAERRLLHLPTSA